MCKALEVSRSGYYDWRNRKPSARKIFNKEYASKEFRSILEKYNITQSMSRKGNCRDNAPAENFF